MATIDLISHAELLERLTYEPETGVFRWKKHKRHHSLNGQEVGSLDAYGYKTIRLGPKGKNRSYKLHRLAWFYVTGEWPLADVDHINGIRTDNRFANLRDVSRKLNLENTAGRRIGVEFDLPPGVCRARTKFSAHLSHNDKTIHLGVWRTPEEAGAAYVAAKRLLHKGYVPTDVFGDAA